MKRTKKFWIRERYNPQLGIYFVPCGQISNTAANEMEKCLYGENTMHSFDTEKAYLDKLEQLKAQGEKIV